MKGCDEVFTVGKEFFIEVSHLEQFNAESFKRSIKTNKYKVKAFIQSEELDKNGNAIPDDFFDNSLKNFFIRIKNTIFCLKSDQEVNHIKNCCLPIYFVDFIPTAESISKSIYENLECYIYSNEDLRCLQIKSVYVRCENGHFSEFSRQF